MDNLKLIFGLTLLASSLIPTAASFALQPGLYHGGGSRYIVISQQGERLCYQGWSSNGTTTASLIKTRNGFQVYQFSEADQLDIIETSATTFLFGGSSTYTRIDTAKTNSLMQACLNSPNHFFEQQLIR